MKIFLFFLAISITLAAHGKNVKSPCRRGVWGCPAAPSRASVSREEYSSRSQGEEVRLDIGRREVGEDASRGKGCAFGDRRCRERMLRLLDGLLERKRQVDCPFGVWGCKRVVEPEAPEEPNCRRRTSGCKGKRRHRREVNDLIEELFAESRTAPK